MSFLEIYVHKRGRVPYPIAKSEIVIKIASEFVMCFVSIFLLKKQTHQSYTEPFAFSYTLA
ncbi:hypothetical protein AKG34_19655 [Peribacillus butanolivorans]|nr:hypothetical protein AKG34_19655 [Peribacillus butanolivorans]